MKLVWDLMSTRDLSVTRGLGGERQESVRYAADSSLRELRTELEFSSRKKSRP